MAPKKDREGREEESTRGKEGKEEEDMRALHTTIVRKAHRQWDPLDLLFKDVLFVEEEDKRGVLEPLGVAQFFEELQ